MKYVATLFAFLIVAFFLSWCAVYSFWIGGHIFQSVQAVRVGDAIGSVILFPARTLLGLSGGMIDQTTLLTNPLLYASINATLIGVLGYSICRRFIFRNKGGG